MRKRVVIGAVIVLAGAAVLAAWRWYAMAHATRTAIRGSGIIEVTQVDAAFEVAGRMVERFVDEGMMIDGGEPIARLDEREYRLRVDRATGAKAAAEAHYAMMLRGPREQEVDQALAAQESAQSTSHLAQLNYERIAKLAGTGIVSKEELDRASTDLTNARKAEERAGAQLTMLREGFRVEEIEQARAQLHQAQAELELAELDLARTKLFAPLAGRVLSKSREPGEMVQPGTPIVTIGDLSRPWVNLYIGERDLGRVRLGMKAQVLVDSFPNQPFPGTVTFVSDRAEFTPKNIQTPDERVKLVYRVKVDVTTRDQALKPGMPVDTVLPLDQDGGTAPVAPAAQ
jgi:HlyD family secretion protein